MPIAGTRRWMWLPEDLTDPAPHSCGVPLGEHCRTCSVCPGSEHLDGYVCAGGES